MEHLYTSGRKSVKRLTRLQQVRSVATLVLFLSLRNINGTQLGGKTPWLCWPAPKKKTFRPLPQPTLPKFRFARPCHAVPASFGTYLQDPPRGLNLLQQSGSDSTTRRRKDISYLLPQPPRCLRFPIHGLGGRTSGPLEPQNPPQSTRPGLKGNQGLKQTFNSEFRLRQ